MKDFKEPPESVDGALVESFVIQRSDISPDEIKRLAGMFGITTKLAGYYVSLIESWEIMVGEAEMACQREQSDEPFFYELIRQMEDHRKSCRMNLP